MDVIYRVIILLIGVFLTASAFCILFVIGYGLYDENRQHKEYLKKVQEAEFTDRKGTVEYKDEN